MSAIAAIILAAGLGRRFGGGPAKPAALFRNDPMVRHVVRAAFASRARPVLLVVGHERERVLDAASDPRVVPVLNGAYEQGLSTSLKAGFAAMPPEVEGAVILLADMPLVSPATIDALIAASSIAPEAVACVPVHGGRRGNPVLLMRRLAGEIEGLTGDQGAGPLLRARAGVREVAVDDPGILVDFDTVAAVEAGTSS